MSVEQWLLLVGWGTLVGLDLVSGPQVMIARPLVAGAATGLLLGDVAAGLRVGIIFELFQFDILPVGAARYPEYGPATVAAVSAATLADGALGVGLGGTVGLCTALAGGWSLHVLRRLNTRAVRRAVPRLEAGDGRALVRLHLAAVLRDAARAALVTTLGLGLAGLARGVVGAGAAGGGELHAAAVTLLAVAVTGAALAAGASGLLRLVGQGATLRWFAAGLLGGAVTAWLR